MQLKNEPNEMKALINELKKKGSPVVLYGAADAGKNYAEILGGGYDIPITCFIDDDVKKQGNKYCGIDVLSLKTFLEQMDGNETILIASYSPSVIIHKIQGAYPFLYPQIKWSDFYLWENGMDYLKYYQDNMEEIDDALKLLCDERSKKVFENLLNYKISRKHILIETIQDNAEEQYFAPGIMEFSDREIFLDLGAYSGDTATAFSKRVNRRYERMIAVEPDADNFKLLIQNTSDLPKVDHRQVGVAAKDGRARLTSQTYTSHFDEKGEQEIRTMSVDSMLDGERVTFIKADIEGSEMEMLKGSEQTIRTYKPKLAIAVYHKKADIFRIPLLLYDYRKDYKFYIRHYTEMPIDTVLYAI